jgi:exopolysaccharide biosynthesis polyprenyl glycosylphosphotransferase
LELGEVRGSLRPDGAVRPANGAVSVDVAYPWPDAARSAGSRRPANRIGVDLTSLVFAAVVLELVDAPRRGFGHVQWLVAYFACVVAIMAARGLYRARLVLGSRDDGRRIVGATTIAALVMVFAQDVLRARPAPHLAGLVLDWGVTSGVLILGRSLFWWAEMRARRRGERTRRTLIVGAGTVGSVIARRLKERPELGLKPVAFLDAAPLEDVASSGTPVVGSGTDIGAVVDAFDIDHVVVSFSGESHDVLLNVVSHCDEHGIAVSIVPRLFERVTRRVDVDHLGGISLLTVSASNPNGWEVAIKYAVDRMLAGALLLLLSPVLLLCAVATRISIGSPVFFRQTRVGVDGRVFEMLKFRSMRPADVSPDVAYDLPPDTAPGGVEGSDRRSRVGGFMRATSLDELPQLFNVLRGEMSIVGPRPERPAFARIFDESVYRYGDRLRMKSGITGWAQVNGLRGKTSISDRVEWDNYYIENWSLWLDLKIVLRTLTAVFASSVE